MPTVLLVDDEPNIRWTMGEMLRRAGYEVLAAGDYDGAVSLIEVGLPDAAVIDINLPRKSGLELLRHFQERGAFVPVIVITGEPSIAQTPELVRAGAYDYISKPVGRDALLAAVGRALDKKRLVEEKCRLEEELKRHAERLESLVAERTAELAAAHNFLDTLLNSSTEYAIVAIDRQGRATLFNRGAELMFGRREAEMMGRPLDLLFVEPAEAVLPAWAREAETHGRHQIEAELRRTDGSTFFALLTATPIYDAGGASLGVLAILKDLTAERAREAELRAMQERLAHNEKIAALGRMAAQVAHEVRNPLAGLRLYALHLRDKAAGRLAANEAALVEKIIGGINHLSDTVDQVLNFARPLTLKRRPADLRRVVAEAAQLLEPQLAAGRIEARYDLPEAAPTLLLDEAAFRSALINLMVNAIQAMPQGGDLSVSVAQEGPRLRLTVADTGVGMSDEQARNAFEPFYTTRSQGLGLGMPYACKVVEQHGGAVRINSRAGAGTQIHIELPVEV